MFCDAEFVIDEENPRRVLIDTEDLMKMVITGKHQAVKSNPESNDQLILVKLKSSQV